MRVSDCLHARILCRKLFEDMLGRAPMLKGILLPALVQHTKAARSGYVKADGIALLLAFLRSCANKVRPSHPCWRMHLFWPVCIAYQRAICAQQTAPAADLSITDLSQHALS